MSGGSQESIDTGQAVAGRIGFVLDALLSSSQILRLKRLNSLGVHWFCCRVIQEKKAAIRKLQIEAAAGIAAKFCSVASRHTLKEYYNRCSRQSLLNCDRVLLRTFSKLLRDDKMSVAVWEFKAAYRAAPIAAQPDSYAPFAK